MRALDAELAAGLAELRAARRDRGRATVESREAGCARIRVGGRVCLDFCGNDYLGLATHPQVIAALVDAARTWGVGSGASHLVSGHTLEHHALEEELAEFVGRPRAVLFSTGYMANLAVVRALAGRGGHVLEDRLNHASLIDAGLASGARLRRYAHADADSLGTRLAAAGAGHRIPPDAGPAAGRRHAQAHVLVATDGVFSMDGDVAPLRDLAALCREHGAVLYVDDAHGFGVLGENGRGSMELSGLGIDDVPALMCTLGKAAGGFGAFVAGSNELAETLIQGAREYIYTTALPPAVAAAARASLRVMKEEPWRRATVLRHATRFRREAARLGLVLTASGSAIQPLVLGSEAAALAASAALLEEGLFVPAIRPPTVPAGTSRLRITFSAAHTDADLDRLLASLTELQARGLLS